MGGVLFFEVWPYRMLRPTCIQKCVEKPSILRSEIGQNRRKFAFSFHVRFDVDFLSIFGGSGVHSGLPLGVPGGAKKGQKGVKKGSCYKTAIQVRLGIDFGAILDRFWEGFGEPKRGMIIPLDLGFCNGFGILFGKVLGTFLHGETWSRPRRRRGRRPPHMLGSVCKTYTLSWNILASASFCSLS